MANDKVFEKSFDQFNVPESYRSIVKAMIIGNTKAIADMIDQLAVETQEQCLTGPQAFRLISSLLRAVMEEEETPPTESDDKVN